MWLAIQLWHSCYGNLIDIDDLAAHEIECEGGKKAVRIPLLPVLSGLQSPFHCLWSLLHRHLQ